MSNHLNGIQGNRKKLTEDLFRELQESNIQAFNVLFEALKIELNNISDVGIEIRIRQNKRFE